MIDDPGDALQTAFHALRVDDELDELTTALRNLQAVNQGNALRPSSKRLSDVDHMRKRGNALLCLIKHALRRKFLALDIALKTDNADADNADASLLALRQRMSDLHEMKKTALALMRTIRHELDLAQERPLEVIETPIEDVIETPDIEEESIETPELGEALQPFATEVEEVPIAILVDADETVAVPIEEAVPDEPVIAIEVAPIVIHMFFRPRTGRGKFHAREFCGNSDRMLPTGEAPSVNDRCGNCYGIQPDAVQ